MPIKDYSGSDKKQDCYRTEHGGSATLWISTAERDWLFVYSHLLHVEWNPSDLLKIFFSSHQVNITGQNLKPIVEALSNLSLAEITIKFVEGDLLKEGHPVIREINVIGIEE